MSFNPERLNIRDLTIEEPETKSELPFDVERDINEEDYQELNKKLEEYRGKNDYHSLSYFAMEMKILKPDTVIDKKDWRGAQDGLAINPNVSTFPGWRVAMKILNPDYGKKIPISDNYWDAMNRKLDEERKAQGSHWKEFSRYAMNMKILNPEMIKINEDDWKGMEEELKWYNEKSMVDFYSQHAMSMKVLDPRHIHSEDLNWVDMKKFLSRLRKGKNYHDFARQFLAMKILASDEVKIKEDNLELIMPERLSIAETPIPEKRDF